LSQTKNAASATPTDVSKDEISLLRTLKELGVPPSRLTKLLSPKEETPAPARADEFDLVDVYRQAYSKALAISLQRQALRDAGLLTQEQERPRNNEIQSQDGMQALLQFLKERPRDEKLTVSDLTMLILASNLGGGNKADNTISLKDLLPLLSKRELTVADVMAILDKTRPPPPPAPIPQSSGGLNDLLDDSVKTVLRDKIVKALTEETKKGAPTDWGQVANHVIEAIRGLTSRIPPAEAPPPEAPGEPIPLEAPATSQAPPPSSSASESAASPSTSGTPTQDLGGIEG
jgi:DNA-binding transcriptional MerR regulator